MQSTNLKNPATRLWPVLYEPGPQPVAGPLQLLLIADVSQPVWGPDIVVDIKI